MNEYEFSWIERKWQKYWEDHQIFQTNESSGKSKFYVLDMFPYPSGSGLHVGHPLGYIASDIFARFQRIKGYEVLHPMGFDAFGLPAEQYAIETGQHPAVTTEENAQTYKQQLKKLGLSYDWSREFKTSDPDYYKWTQWIFIQLFESWYNCKKDKAEPIEELVKEFNANGNQYIDAISDPVSTFTGDEWRIMNYPEKETILQKYRLAYLADSEVNWCPALGTVLANDEVQNGYSVRGGHPVEKKQMSQWFLRITAYAERLLRDLETLDWPESIKDIQRNWIGKSIGASIHFPIQGMETSIEVFTTRPDTIFGSTFMVIAPEHPLVDDLTTADQTSAIQDYIKETKRKSERERIAEYTDVSGAFTGSYAKNPITGEALPIYIADYVLMDYGSGAIMAVPGHDERDHAFANQYNLSIKTVVDGGQPEGEVYSGYEGKLINADFLNGLDVTAAIEKAITELEQRGIGHKETNYRIRDAVFSRQRYWGEPFPIRYNRGIPVAEEPSSLPIELPEVDSFEPGEDGDSPLSRNQDWVNLPDGSKRETKTMPGFAGSSWYFLRYMDPHNDETFVSSEREQFWQQVDFYVGGSEHATGHLMYARFWQKLLFDLGQVSKDEPFKKLINQGMIQGISAFAYRIKDSNTFVSKNLKDQYDTIPVHIDIKLINNKDELNIEDLRKWRKEFKDSEFILEDGKYIVGREVEKMSKSKHNVINPDEVIEQYGCDTFRLYEMFLGPVEQSKPWKTEGIEGVYRFLRKFWNLFFDQEGNWAITNDAGDEEELKTLHKTIKHVLDHTDSFALNTCVSQFMICTNELHKKGTSKREILEPLVILISPFAPHMAEELWERLGYDYSVSFANCPACNSKWLQEDTFEYPISINGKVRAKETFPIDQSQEEIEKTVFEIPAVKKWTEGKSVKKIVYVPGKIINIVVG